MSVRWPGLDNPGVLPNDFQQDSYSEGNIDNLIRTRMNNGPDKRRRRTTEAYQPIKGTMILDSAQREAFLEFYKGETLFGAIPVIMREPGTIDGEIQTFINTQSIVPINGLTWSLDMSLSVLVS
jgi:hypothetical protein